MSSQGLPDRVREQRSDEHLRRVCDLLGDRLPGSRAGRRGGQGGGPGPRAGLHRLPGGGGPAARRPSLGIPLLLHAAHTGTGQSGMLLFYEYTVRYKIDPILTETGKLLSK